MKVQYRLFYVYIYFYLFLFALFISISIEIKSKIIYTYLSHDEKVFVGSSNTTGKQF